MLSILYTLVTIKSSEATSFYRTMYCKYKKKQEKAAIDSLHKCTAKCIKEDIKDYRSQCESEVKKVLDSIVVFEECQIKTSPY